MRRRQRGRPAPGARIFAVGDEKQSIFSFQGAAPEAFDVMRRLFAQQFDTPDLGWKFLRFHHSFRSGAAVCSVHQVFSGREVTKVSPPTWPEFQNTNCCRTLHPVWSSCGRWSSRSKKKRDRRLGCAL